MSIKEYDIFHFHQSEQVWLATDSTHIPMLFAIGVYRTTGCPINTSMSAMCWICNCGVTCIQRSSDSAAVSGNCGFSAHATSFLPWDVAVLHGLDWFSFAAMSV